MSYSISLRPPIVEYINDEQKINTINIYIHLYKLFLDELLEKMKRTVFVAAFSVATLIVPVSAQEMLFPSNACLIVRIKQNDKRVMDLMNQAERAGSPQEQQQLMLQATSQMRKFTIEVNSEKYRFVRPLHEYGSISENDSRCSPLD